MHQPHATIILHNSFTQKSSGWEKNKKKKRFIYLTLMADVIPALLGHDLGLSDLFSRMPGASATLGQIKHVPISSPAISEHLEVVR